MHLLVQSSVTLYGSKVSHGPRDACKDEGYSSDVLVFGLCVPSEVDAFLGGLGHGVGVLLLSRLV